MDRPSSFFRGSELPRLLFLAAVMVVGWAVVWNYAQKLNHAAEQEVTVQGKPEPVVPDQSVEFETVTDRTPMGFRDNAAYALLLERRFAVAMRTRSPQWPGATCCCRTCGKARSSTGEYRFISWEPPVECCVTNQKLSKSGWLYEASIITRKQREPRTSACSEDAGGFPIGPNV